MDRKVVDYVIAFGEGEAGLNKDVVSRLQDGWELYGNPYALLGERYSVHFQAMVKYEEGNAAESYRRVHNIMQSGISPN